MRNTYIGAHGNNNCNYNCRIVSKIIWEFCYFNKRFIFHHTKSVLRNVFKTVKFSRHFLFAKYMPSSVTFFQFTSFSMLSIIMSYSHNLKNLLLCNHPSLVTMLMDLSCWYNSTHNHVRNSNNLAPFSSVNLTIFMPSEKICRKENEEKGVLVKGVKKGGPTPFLNCDRSVLI